MSCGELAAPQEGDQSFLVRLARSGGEWNVPAGRTILDVLLEGGLDIDYSCSEGTCGTCITNVLEGEIEHRDTVLTEAERASGRSIAICCSRARGLLVLDL